MSSLINMVTFNSELHVFILHVVKLYVHLYMETDHKQLEECMYSYMYLFVLPLRTVATGNPTCKFGTG